MGGWGVAWLFAAVFRKPSLGGVFIATLLWVVDPLRTLKRQTLCV